MVHVVDAARPAVAVSTALAGTRGLVHAAALGVRGRAGASAVGGECLSMSLVLAGRLVPLGLDPFIVRGAFRLDRSTGTRPGGLPETPPRGLEWLGDVVTGVDPHASDRCWPHWWVEVDDLVVDITADQSGEWLRRPVAPVIVSPVGRTRRHVPLVRARYQAP